MGGKYQTYPEYKDSGVEWLGDIPAHWEISKLRYMFTFGKGLTITKENLLDEGVPCVNYGEVHSKYGFEVDPSKHPLKCVSEDYLKSSSSALLLKGDLVFADTSEDIDGSGNFTQLTGEQQVFAGYHTIIARPANRSASRFYAYLVDSQEFRAQIRNAVKGVKVFSVTQAMLRGANVWLPQEEEQQKIANFLDHETARIDTLIEKQQQLIKLLKEKRQAVISHAVTKGLNPDAPMRDSGVEWLGEVPAHWNVSKFNYEIDFQEGPGILANDFYDEGVPLLRIQNVKEEFVSDNFKTFLSPEKVQSRWDHFRVELGDLIISCSASTGLVSEVDERTVGTIPYTGLIRLRPRSNKICKDFIRYLVQSDLFFEQIDVLQTGATIQHFGPAHLQQMYITLPHVDEQLLIVEFIKVSAARLDTLIGHAENAILLMQERRTALISAAVTGKIDVRDWHVPDQENKDAAA